MAIKKEYILFTLYRVFYTQNFILPVKITWFLLYSMSLSEISILKVIFSFSIMIFEIPTGILADLISKKISMILGTILFSIHAIFYIIYPSFIGFAITQILLALSGAFISGADTAYLHTFIKEKTNDKYLVVYGKIEFIKKITSAIIAIFCSYLYVINSRIVFIGTSLLGLLSLVSVLLLPGDYHKKENRNFNELIKEYIVIPQKAIRVILNNKTLTYLILSTSIIFSFLIFNFEMYQVKFKLMGISTKYFGLIYASFMLIMGIGGKYANLLVESLSYKYTYLGIGILIIISFIFFGTSNNILLIFTAIIFQQFAFGSWGVIFNKILLDNCPENQIKSTIGSLNSFSLNLVKMILIMFLGYFSDLFLLKNTYYLMSFFLFILFGTSVYFLKFKKVVPDNAF